MTDLTLTLRTQASRPHLLHGGGHARALRIAAVLMSVVRFVFRLPAHALLLSIRLYQRFLSPALPAIFGSTCGCRFVPTCSHYAAEAIRVHGAIAGVLLAAVRLVKCTPLHPGGFNPVPLRRSNPRCTRKVA
jgi:uncharacterized protein